MVAVITVHVGLHKTGTSSIQTALRQIRHRRDIAIAVPGDVHGRDVPAFLAWLNRQTTATNVLMSDEGLFGEAAQGYPLLDERMEELSTGRVGRWQVIVVVREPLAWLGSLYLQTLQEGEHDTAERFWERVRSYPRLSALAMVTDLRSRLPEGALRVGVMTRGRDVVDDFFQLAGLGQPPRGGAGGIRENVSITPAQGVILRHLNADMEATTEDRAKFRYFLQTMAADASGSHFSPFNSDIQREIRETLGRDWSNLGNVLRDDPILGGITYGPQTFSANGPRPYVGETFADRMVEDEILRSIRVAAWSTPPRHPSWISRAVFKANNNPKDAWPALVRRIRGRAIDY